MNIQASGSHQTNGHPAGLGQPDKIAVMAHDSNRDELVELLHRSALGGDLQLCPMVVDGGVDAVMFPRNHPYGGHVAEDVTALIRVSDMNQVPIATNAATARAVLGHLPLLPDGPVSESGGQSGTRRVADSNRN